MDSLDNAGYMEDCLAKKCVDPYRNRIKDKKDRQTHDRVIDGRVRNIIRKMSNSGIIDNIYGCVSSGKEANVYAAKNTQGETLAVKIYQTSILDYKKRQRFISSDIRYALWPYSNNPRKMVKKWAEKEYRNLIRLTRAGINCPNPIKLIDNVLVMSMLGRNGIALPKLKNVDLSHEHATKAFKDIIFACRKMYQECKLVHGDLSEYNILIDIGNDPNIDSPKIYIIDVSQSVESYSEWALTDLRRDIYNIIQYFGKFGVKIPPFKMVFDFISDFTKNNEDLEDLWEANLKVTPDELNDTIFKEMFIPKNLSEVINIEEDFDNLKLGNSLEINYDGVTGMAGIFFGSDSPSDEDEDKSSENDSFSDKEMEQYDLKIPTSKQEIKMQRKENKKMVKENNRIRRQNKASRKHK